MIETILNPLTGVAERCVKLPIKKACAQLNISDPGLRKRIQKFGWKQEKDETGRSFVWIPEKLLDQPDQNRSEPEITTDHNEVATNHNQVHNSSQPGLETVLHKVATALENQSKLMETVQILNRELENRNTALVKYREQEKQIENLVHRLEQLETELRTRSKPWWRFWQ
jgi:BMFP domain-containing protein YqiC